MEISSTREAILAESTHETVGLLEFLRLRAICFQGFAGSSFFEIESEFMRLYMVLSHYS